MGEGRLRTRRSPWTPKGFLKELADVGLIVEAGHNERGDLCWSVIHRTFLEFLAALGLAQETDWLTEARQHFWFQPEWAEVLTFLAGLVDDAQPLIEAVEGEQRNDDLFRSMLALKTRLVGAAHALSPAVAGRIAEEVLAVWQKVVSALSPWLEALWRPLTQNPASREKSVESLLPLLNDEDWLVREVAGKALGEIGYPGAVKSLIALLSDEHWNVRWAAAEALGKIGDPGAVKPLIALLSDEYWYMRKAAAEALGKIGDRSAVKPLIALLSDEERDVRKAAAEALEEINPYSNKNRGVAAEALGKIGDRSAVKPLIALLSHEDWIVRWAAANALGRIGDRSAVEPLIALLGGEDWIVRGAAAQALWQISWKNQIRIPRM